MYNCPNCGAGMRYDIRSKKLLCDYCGSSVGIGNHPEQLTAAEQDEYDATVFTCPQCGGRILSTDHAASDFCTYCGASVTLEGRLSSEKKPKYIIPFTRTKEDCSSSYKDYVQGIWCLPEAYKSEKFLEKFEGIYMPFWVYQFSQTGQGTFRGTRMSGSYKEYCYVHYDLDNQYTWILYDAASLFDDEISAKISFYPETNAVEFDPAYMSGFYAEIAEVDFQVYLNDAEDDVNEKTLNSILNRGGYSNITPDSIQDFSGGFNTKRTGILSVLCPVWFVTWRKQKRIAYAVVNGCSGSCYADVPVSIPKYLLFSLIFAVPFTLLFLALPVMLAKTMLIVVLGLAMIMMLIYYKAASQAAARDLHLSDKGYMDRHPSDHPELRSLAASTTKRRRWYKRELSKPVQAVIIIASIVVILITRLPYKMVPYAIGLLFELITPGSMIASVFFCAQGIRLSRAVNSSRILIDVLILGGTTMISAVIRLSNPMHDYYYYFGAVLVLLGILTGAVGLIGQYNWFCTHPIPEYFNREEVGKNA